jgi:anti-sigma regulatory factor (Ser/Thr protein kinase)
MDMTAPLTDEVSRELPLGVHAVGVARQIVSETLGRRGLNAEDIAAAELLASELVTNAVLYGYGAHTLTLRFENARLRILVSDSSPSVPTRRTAHDDDEIGRGMQLIEAYAESWGVEPHDHGKAVWCQVVLARD